uniref:Uncharacterized protein n=1 Tax=Megaselia scalaris TaxID=36166 RepID=T1GJM8_MEGSC
MLSRQLLRRTFFTYTNELSYPIPNRKPPIVPVEEAVSVIKSDDVVFLSSAYATPEYLVNGMVKHAKAKDLKNISLPVLLAFGEGAYCKPEYKKHFRTNSFFIGSNIRKSVAEGDADYMSIHLQDIPKVFNNGIIKPDVALIHVSPIDEHGFLAQINKQMVRTFGDSLIHSSHFDYAVEIDEPLMELKSSDPSDDERKIGHLIAENLVEDGSTLQMGIGKIPDAVLEALGNHKNLGIHTEMFSNGILPLYEKGCVTNSEKRNHRGKIVSTFVMGDRNLYDFVDNNPMVELYGSDHTNNTKVISANPKVVAINSCIEIDLTGQICSESIGTGFFSGFGGQVDFMRGAAEGFDGKGKPIIAFTSTTAKGTSKIVPTLKPGAGIVTSRAHVHYVVTEYGIACLFGKNMRQRAYELIKIAHPDHRESLEREAFERLKVMPSAQ